MKITTSLSSALLALAGLLWLPAALAQQKSPAPLPSAIGPEYSEKGADTCLYCHDAESDSATFTTAGIFKSKHGHRRDKRSPFGPGGLQCEACHGPGASHAVKDSKKIATINSLKANSFVPVAERNQVCLGCHDNTARNAWHDGKHGARGQLACTDCHKMHVERDPVLAKATEPGVCFQCHKSERADFHKSSVHPVRFGRMGCSDCHSAHGSNAVAMLNKPTLNQTCTSCHADKRGPVLWEHAPVSEDCSLCHSSHGSVRPALLTKSPAVLCQQCHSPAGHPSVPRTGDYLPGGAKSSSGIFLVAGSCTNCHSQVHGSNHPAGAKLMR